MSNINKKIGKSIGKTIIKTVKKFGIRPDDITDMLSEADIDGLIASELLKLKSENADNIVLIGSYDGKDFKFKAHDIIISETENGKIAEIGNSHTFTFFGKSETDHFTLTGLIKDLLELLFNSFEKDKKKK